MKTRDHVEGRALAASRRPEQSDELSIRNHEIEVLDGDGVANVLLGVAWEDLRQVFDFDFHKVFSTPLFLGDDGSVVFHVFS